MIQSLSKFAKSPFNLLSICLVLATSSVYAAAPKVGRNAAAKYFQEGRGNNSDSAGEYQQPVRRHPSTIEQVDEGDRYLTFGLTSYMSSDSYKWGSSGSEEKVGKWGVDLTYRLNVINNLMDESLRVSYTEFEPMGKRASKMSFLYTLMLPDAGSRFPLYFGGGVGPGVFFKQLENESPLSLDYQLFLGLRLFNLFENTGFYVEGGLKNHLQLTSDGQVNGTYLAAGMIFTF